MNIVSTYQQIKSRKGSKYIAPTGNLANNTTGHLLNSLINLVTKPLKNS